MNTRNKLIEWLEAEDDTQTYSELDLGSYVLELANDASLTECVHEDKEYNPTLLRKQINSISSLIKQIIAYSAILNVLLLERTPSIKVLHTFPVRM